MSGPVNRIFKKRRNEAVSPPFLCLLLQYFLAILRVLLYTVPMQYTNVFRGRLAVRHTDMGSFRMFHKRRSGV